MKIVFRSISYIFLILNSICLLSQESNSEINFGIGLSKVDSRYDFLNGNFARGLAESDKSPFGYEVYINYNHRILGSSKFLVYSGIGYNLQANLFKLTINNFHFNYLYDIFLTNDIYYKHNIFLPIDFRYLLKKSDKNKLAITASINSNFTFLKYLAIDKYSNLHVFKFDLSSIELYPGIRYEKGKMVYNLQCRLLNLQFKDDALFNNGKEIDLYNPIKFRFSIGKKL